MPIIDLQKRLSEAGRIRIGKTVASSNGKARPTKLESFRFTTQSEDAAKMLSALYGGDVAPWKEAPTGKQFEVISEADALRVMVPPEAMGFSQWYELWKAGGCERRCDGDRRATGEACICDPENRECKPHTRLSVMITEMPTSGLWRLDTSGYYAATELSGGFELARLIASSTGRSVLGATLRLEQREVKRPGTTVKRFAVPVLDFDVDPGALVGEPGAPRLAVTPVPAIAAPSLAEQMKAVDEPNEKPKRANAAPEVKPTGLKPRRAEPAVDIPADIPEAEPSPKVVDAVATPAVVPTEAKPAKNLAAEFAQFFNDLKDGEAASLRWMVLRNHGWSTDAGNDVYNWALTQSPATLTTAFDDLMATREKAIAK